jgi:hypothetical protein
MKNITTGHDHDGVDSKKVDATNLDNLDTFVGFNTSTGHDHNGVNSKITSIGIVKCDVSSTDTSEYSTAGTTPQLVKTYTFTPTASNNVVVAVGFAFETKSSIGTRYVRSYMDFGGTIIANVVTGGGTNYVTAVNNNATTYSGIATTSFNLASTPISDSDGTVGSLKSLPNSAASYTINLYLWGSAAGTSYIKNIVMYVWYVDNVTVTTSSPKFS